MPACHQSVDSPRQGFLEYVFVEIAALARLAEDLGRESRQNHRHYHTGTPEHTALRALLCLAPN